MLRDERRVVDRRHDESMAQTLRILEGHARVVARRPSAASRLSQKSSADRSHAPLHGVHHSRARVPPRRTPGYSKNVMSLPGVPLSA